MAEEEDKVEAICLTPMAWRVPRLTLLGGGGHGFNRWMDPVCLSTGEEMCSGGVCRWSLLCWWLAELLGRWWEMYTNTSVQEYKSCLWSYCPLVVRLQCVMFPALLPRLQVKHGALLFHQRTSSWWFCGWSCGKGKLDFHWIHTEKISPKNPKRKDVPARGRGVGTRWSLRSLPTQPILWFYLEDQMQDSFKKFV